MRWLILYKTESTIFNVILSEPKMNILINNLFIFIEIFKCNLHFIIFHMPSIESLSLHFPTRDILWVIPTCLTLSLNKRFCFKIRKRYFYLFTKKIGIFYIFWTNFLKMFDILDTWKTVMLFYVIETLF